MERYRVTAGYDASLRQCKESIPFSVKPQHLREPCFPTRLRPPAPADDRRLRRLKEDSELSIFDAERYFNEGDEDGPEEHRVPRKESALSRVDASPDPRESISLSSFEGGRRSRGNVSLYATPTASSEASWNSRSGLLTNPPGSVAVSVRAFPLSEQRKSSASACRWLLGRSCPCSGKRAVEVQEKYEVPTSPSRSNFDSIASVSLNRKDSQTGEAASVDEFAVALKELEMGSEWEMTKLKLVAGNGIKEQDLFRDPCDHLSPGKHFPPEVACHRIVRAGKPFKDGGRAFSFPVLVQPITATSAGKPANSVSTTRIDDLGRDSLEVFRPAEEATPPKNTADLPRSAVTQLPLFPRDAAPRRSFTFPPSPSGRVAAVEDDLASDSSSDLFEIESLSTQATYRRRDSLDEPRRPAGGGAGAGVLRLPTQRAPSVALSECYPPSEVSVEWSVATAEGGFGPGSVANFSSAASDCDSSAPGFARLDQQVFATAVAAGGGRRRSGGLLSCRCEKAVSVGPNPVRFGTERRHQAPTDKGGRGRRE